YGEAHNRADTGADPDEPANLAVDFGKDLQRHLLIGQRWTDEPHDLSLERIARNHQVIRQTNHDGELRDERKESVRALPDPFTPSEGRLFDANGLNAIR